MRVSNALKRHWHALRHPDQGSRTPVGINIRPRQMGFTLESGYRNNWAKGDPIKTSFLNAVSCILPMGEDFFLKTMRNYRGMIRDDQLQKDARHFCGQEGHHAFEHRKFNQLLADTYPRLESLDRVYQRINDWILSKSSPALQFSYTTGAEHLTSILSHAFLSDAERWVDDYDEIAAMLIWHTVEEIEHKSVCFDVFQHVDGHYGRRLFGFAVLNLWLSSAVVSRQLYMLQVEGLLTKPETWRHLLSFYLGIYKDNKPGIVPMLINDWLQYFRPDFHPWEVDDRHLIQHWLTYVDTGNDPRSVPLQGTTQQNTPPRYVTVALAG